MENQEKVPDGVYALADPSAAITAFNLNYEFNLFSQKAHLIGTTFKHFPVINDEPRRKELVQGTLKQDKNFRTGITVSVILGGLAACAVVVTGGVGLGVMMLACAAVMVGTATVAAASEDRKNNRMRSKAESHHNRLMGIGRGVMAGATIYGLWTSLPVAGKAMGIQAAQWLDKTSKFTYSVVPKMVNFGGFSLIGLQSIRGVNEGAAIGSGNNWLVDKLFDEKQEAYDDVAMLLDMISIGVMQLAADNAGLTEVEEIEPFVENDEESGNIMDQVFEGDGQYSGKLEKVNNPDENADKLAERIGGESRVKFSNDPVGREFDVVTDEYIAQAKPALTTINKSVRVQMKATFDAAAQTGKKVYYQFEGQPAQSVINKLIEYSERYGIEVVIDTTPLN